MQKEPAKTDKLARWQNRLSQSNSAYSAEVKKMDERERLYNGERTLTPLVKGDHKRDGGPNRTSHVRNVIFENIESQISAAIPQPKVTPRRQKDERLAEIIENFLRNELDRLPFETMNDMAERTVPIQGGVGFLVEWDNLRRTHNTIGEAQVSVIHPKQFAPQPGVYTSIADMDWFIIKIPTTKEAVRRDYNVDVYLESESEPDIRTPDSSDVSDDAVTQYIGFEKNDEGGINRYSWVNDVQLEDLVNYQARRQSVCESCGNTPTSSGQFISGGVDEHSGICPWCGGGKLVSREQEFEQVMLPIKTAGGVEVEGAHPELDETGVPVLKPTLIPFYKPDIYPVILQRSVSVYGQLLGNSDIDQIRDQQNTINRIEQKIIDRLIKAGTRITLPDRPDLRTDPEDGERWYIGNAADKSLIDIYDFTGNLEYELLYLSNVYEEARQIIGITDSFQGRRDTTATSGKAKEFSAAQAAGRLESKRVMKDAAYAELFELMFKFWLAYSDEPRPVVYKNYKGDNEYLEFNRYDFLERDESGEWFWNDRFLFSCDSSAPLSSNREAMWQETRMNLQTGSFGDPTSTETLILFWSKMEQLHYPGAGSTKKFLEERLEREQQELLQKQQAQAAQQEAMRAQQTMSAQPETMIPPELGQAIERQAREAAMRDAAAGAGGAKNFTSGG